MRRLSGLVVAGALSGALLLGGCSATSLGGTPQPASNGLTTSPSVTAGADVPDAPTSSPDTAGASSPSAPTEPSLGTAIGGSSTGSPVPPVPVATTSSPPGPSTTESTRSTGTTAHQAPTTSTSPRPAPPTTVNGGQDPWQRTDGDAWFQTPDGSVRCAVGPSQGDGRPSAICRVSGHSYSVPTAPHNSCAHWGDFIVLGPDGADFECYTDDRFDTAARVLPTGSTLRFQGFTCQVGTVSTVCQYDSTTQAFTVNVKDYQFWSTAASTAAKSTSKTTTKATTPSTVDGHAAPWNSGYGWADFQSPSGNINCMLGDIADGGGTEVMCEIGHHTYTTPTSSSCTLDYGDRFVLGTAGQATLGCHGDTIVNDAAAVLPYGTSITWGTLTCTSSDTGMWCGDLDTGHHFKVAFAAYELG